MKKPVSVGARCALALLLFACAPVDPTPADDGGRGDVVATTSFTPSAATQQVPAPDYAVDATGLVVQTNAAHVVEAVDGAVALAAGEHRGDALVVSTREPGADHAAIDASWSAASPAPLGGGAAERIGAAALALDGEVLARDVARYVTIARAVDGVRSYQVITLTFRRARE